MISPLYLGYAALGGLIQIVVIWAMRAKGWPFWWVLPAVLANQFFFTAGYAKAPNFTIQWFLTAALSAFASLVLGVLAFGDKLSLMSASGIFLVFVGLGLMKFG